MRGKTGDGADPFFIFYQISSRRKAEVKYLKEIRHHDIRDVEV